MTRPGWGAAGDYRPVRLVQPPVRVLVWPSRIWPPSRLRFGQSRPLWQRSAGLQLSENTVGELTEVIVTQAGDLLCRIVFAVRIDREPHVECMLLPISELWEPLDAHDVQRLRLLVEQLGVRW